MTSKTKKSVSETEQELIETAKNAVSQCNWVLGECAAKWTQRYAKGRTDADFAEIVGLSSDQVYQRRRVWETFEDVRGEYPATNWSHFYLALNWDDSAECLQWANENQATIAEMRAWRRLQHGEDLTTPPELDQPSEDASLISFLPTENTVVVEPGDAIAGTIQPDTVSATAEQAGSGSRATIPMAAREVDEKTKGGGDSDYAPFRQGAMSPPPKEESSVAVAERPHTSVSQTVKRMTTTLQRCQQVLTPEFVEEYRQLPEKVRNRFIRAVGELSSKVTELL